MLPRSLLHLLAGAVLCNAQYQQFFQPQYQPQQQPQYNFWQPQYDPSVYRPQQTAPQQYQPQFQQPPVQYQNQGPPPPPPPQFNQAPPVYQPQFQQQIPQQFAPQPIPQQNYAPQQQFQSQPQFQQPQFQQQPYQVNQSPPPPPPPPPQPRPVPVQTRPFPQQPPQVFREQPVIYEQIVKIPAQPLKRPPPPPQQPTAQIIQIAAPPPPEKFVPYIADIYTGPSNQKPPVITVITPDESLPTGTYIAEEIVVDGNHPAYIENIEKLQPPPRKTTIQQKQSFVPPPQTKFKAPEIASQPRPRPQQPPPPPSPARPPVQARPPPPAPAKSPAAAGSISGNSVNEVFLSCCKKRKVAKSCERICSFDVLNKKTLTGMFLGTDPCPQSYGLDLLQCAAQNDDHTQCCIENGVHTTTAGNKCLGFCNMKPGVSFQADVSMLPCWGVLNDIKDCFQDFIEERIEG